MRPHIHTDIHTCTQTYMHAHTPTDTHIHNHMWTYTHPLTHACTHKIHACISGPQVAISVMVLSSLLLDYFAHCVIDCCSAVKRFTHTCTNMCTHTIIYGHTHSHTYTCMCTHNTHLHIRTRGCYITNGICIVFFL